MTVKMKLKYLLPVLCLSLLASCGGEDIIAPTSERTFGIRHDRALSDYESVAAGNSSDLPDFASVIAFDYSLDGSADGEYIASGVVIAEEWILTAGHNFYDAEEQDNPALPAGITIKTGNDPNTPERTYTVADVTYHPTWLSGNQDFDDANDLCLVRVSEPITGITPVEIFSASNETAGSSAWHCGFGDYTSLEGQDPDLDSKKHAMENVLDRVQGGFETNLNGTVYTGGLLAFDFDNPMGTTNSLGDNTLNTDEALLGTGTSEAVSLNLEGTTVTGDSGGPLFLKDIDGKWKVAGILSGGAIDPIDEHTDGNYGDISIYTRVSSSYDWIQSVIQ